MIKKNKFYGGKAMNNRDRIEKYIDKLDMRREKFLKEMNHYGTDTPLGCLCQGKVIALAKVIDELNDMKIYIKE